MSYFRFLLIFCFVRGLDLLLRRYGFDTVKRWVLLPWKPNSSDVDGDDARVREIEKLVTAACSWQWRRAECLHRAVALYYFLRRCGARPNFVIAVRSRPFASHSWVELGGRVIGDTMEPDARGEYVAILRVPGITDARPAGRCA